MRSTAAKAPGSTAILPALRHAAAQPKGFRIRTLERLFLLCAQSLLSSTMGPARHREDPVRDVAGEINLTCVLDSLFGVWLISSLR